MTLKNVVSFLSSLDENNNRDWMQENKSWYKEAKSDFEGFVSQLLLRMAEVDADLQGLLVKDCTFRINRDIRFSKDKRPYKNNMGAYMAKGGKKSVEPGYYIHIEPAGTFAGGGLYMPATDILSKVRQEIDYNAKPLVSLLVDKDFKNYFGQLGGEKLKTSPKGYGQEHANIDLLRHKSFVVMHSFQNQDVVGAGFLDHVVAGFKTMKPLKDYLKLAIAN